MASELQKINDVHRALEYDQMATKIQIASVLEVFNTPILEMEKLLAFRTMFAVYVEVFSVALAWIAAPLLHMFGMVLMNLVGETKVQAGFGIALSFYELFFYTFLIPLLDKMGIELSRAASAKNKQHMNRVLWQGTFTSLLAFTLITLPIMSSSGWILKFVGVQHETAEIAQKLLWLMQFSCVLEGLIFPMQTFCFAQGVEDAFTLGTVVAFFIGTSVSGVLVLHFGLGMYGWMTGKIVFDIIVLAITIWKLFADTDPDSRGRIAWTEFTKGLFHFLLESFKFALSTYSEYIGYEITSFFVYTNPDQNQIASYVAVKNLTIIMYCLSETAALVARTRINMLVGLKRVKTGKNFFAYFLAATLALGCCYSLVLLVANPWIEVNIAGANSELTSDFRQIMALYRWFCILDSIYLSVIMIMKSLGKVNLLLWVNVVLLGLVNFGGNYLISKVWKLKACFNFLWIYVTLSTTTLGCLAYVFAVDWETIKFELDETEDLPLIEDSEGQNAIFHTQHQMI